MLSGKKFSNECTIIWPISYFNNFFSTLSMINTCGFHLIAFGENDVPNINNVNHSLDILEKCNYTEKFTAIPFDPVLTI